MAVEQGGGGRGGAGSTQHQTRSGPSVGQGLGHHGGKDSQGPGPCGSLRLMRGNSKKTSGQMTK